MNVKYKLRYLTMPDYVYEDPKISGFALKLYCFIHSYNGDYFSFGDNNLMQMFNCSRDSITKGVAKLTELGYIKTEKEARQGGGTIRYIQDLKGKSRSRKSSASEAENPLHRPEANLAENPLHRNEANLASSKEYKDNNIKGNFFSSYKKTDNKIAEKLALLKSRKEKKSTWGFGKPKEKEIPHVNPEDIQLPEDLEVYNIAKEFSVAISDVKRVFKDIKLSVEAGNKYGITPQNLEVTLKQWISNSISRGSIEVLNDWVQKDMLIEYWHPDAVKKRELWDEILKKKEELKNGSL